MEDSSTFLVIQSSWRKERQEIRPNRHIRRVLGVWEVVLIMVSSLACVLREMGSHCTVLIKIKGVT